jgi:hypothetical protein
MVQLNRDLPIKYRNLSQISSLFPELPPGASKVLRTENRGTGWYCQACREYIHPIWMRDGDGVFPSCLECYVEEVLKEGGGDVAILEAEAIADPISIASN